MNYKDLKTGDKIQVDCYTGLGTGGVETVAEIITKHYEHNGEPYTVIVVEGGQQFSTETGEAITPPHAYYITKKI